MRWPGSELTLSRFSVVSACESSLLGSGALEELVELFALLESVWRAWFLERGEFSLFCAEKEPLV